MNVAIVTHFYPPEPCAAATRVASLATALAASGHDVTVVTNFPSFPSGRFEAHERRGLKRVELLDGHRVIRLRSLLARGMPGSRLVHWGSAALAAAAYLAASPTKFDIAIVSTPPITLAFPAFVAVWRHRARLVVDVRDVFPDIAIAMGEWKADGFLARASEWIVRRLYRRADLVVAVTPTALSQIAGRGVDASHLALVRNAAESARGIVAERRSDRGFTAIYAGNLGLATDVDLLIDVAALVSEHGITLEIVGDGAQRARMVERIARERIGNVALVGSMPRVEAMRRIAAADVALVPLRSGIEESVPTKLYDALSVACPAVVAAGGEAEREARELGGFSTPPGDAPALAAMLRGLARMDRAELRRLGETGRRNVQRRADRASSMAELAGRISALA